MIYFKDSELHIHIDIKTLQYVDPFTLTSESD